MAQESRGLKGREGTLQGRGRVSVWGLCPCVPAHSESLLSELEPLELLLPDSEELELLSREGPPEGVELDFSAGNKAGMWSLGETQEGCPPRVPSLTHRVLVTVEVWELCHL